MRAINRRLAKLEKDPALTHERRVVIRWGTDPQADANVDENKDVIAVEWVTDPFA